MTVWLDQVETRLQGPAQEVAQANKEFIGGAKRIKGRINSIASFLKY